jgi:hypothetical protein
VDEGATEARAYFEERGFEIRLSESELHRASMDAGKPGQASFFKEGRLYWVADLVRGGEVVQQDYSHGETEGEALAAARRRFGREQT